MKRYAGQGLQPISAVSVDLKEISMISLFKSWKNSLKEYPEVLKEFENLFTSATGYLWSEQSAPAPISAERALNYGFTGPNLRAAGVDYDVRVHTPYSSYEDFEFNIPVGTTGDCYDRFLVRNQEMWQSTEHH